jgi:hypoxanthine phosphoribosyltransferase
MIEDIDRILLEEATILQRLDVLAREITLDYQDKELTVISLLNGSFIFMADLLRRIPLPLQVDSWSIASYHGTQTSGRVKFRQNHIADVAGRHVLILDDILDSGRTLRAVFDRLEAESGATSIRSCVLLDKKVQRHNPFVADYSGFEIPDEFVVGYGLDYNERYRNLPFIGVLKADAIARHAR